MTKNPRYHRLELQPISLRDTEKRKHSELDSPSILLNRRVMTSFELEEMSWQEGKIKNPGTEPLVGEIRGDQFAVKSKS